MAASDFFENFLLHDGVKSLHPNENLSIVPLVSSRDDTTGGYSADRGSSFLSVGPWWACLCPPVGACVAPATVRLYYAGTRRSLPGNSAFHAIDFARHSSSFPPVFTSMKLYFPTPLMQPLHAGQIRIRASVFQVAGSQDKSGTETHISGAIRPSVNQIEGKHARAAVIVVSAAAQRQALRTVQHPDRPHRSGRVHGI